MADLRKMIDEYSIPDTYIVSQDFIEFDVYNDLGNEMRSILTIAFVGITLVILFITLSFTSTIIILFVVGLVNIYMTGLCHFWGLTMNNLLVINLALTMGLMIDYSTHIAYSYLKTQPPPTCISNREKREYKVAIALSKMSTSVFHSGFTTFLAISVLISVELYTLRFFWKTWTIIILFALLNSMVLQPIILSFIGPINDIIDAH